MNYQTLKARAHIALPDVLGGKLYSLIVMQNTLNS